MKHPPVKNFETLDLMFHTEQNSLQLENIDVIFLLPT
jgi:hypothetical protein